MSEIKRVQLLPLGNQKEVIKSSKECRKTVRISVVLPQSTEDTCPEYNYKDELAAAKKLGKCKESGGLPNGISRLDGLEDNDDDVRRIAKQMEEKYGTSGGGGVSLNKKKRRKRNKDDYADIGMGYDESDSFIDNTDGYDEVVPQEVTTLHGGFYINSGELQFKADEGRASNSEDDATSSSSGGGGGGGSSSEEEDDEDEESSAKKIHNRKRVIESSDETDREVKTDDNKTGVSHHAEKLLTAELDKLDKKDLIKILVQQRLPKNLAVSEPVKQYLENSFVAGKQSAQLVTLQNKNRKLCEQNVKLKKSIKKLIEYLREENIEPVDEPQEAQQAVVFNKGRKRKIQKTANGLPTSHKKKLLAQAKCFAKKRRPVVDTQQKTVKELLREKREDMDMSAPPELTSEDMDADASTSKEGPVKKTMSIANVADSIESVVKASNVKAPEEPEVIEIPMKEPSDVRPTIISSSDGESSHDVAHKKTNGNVEEVKLPENLSTDIVEIIKAIRNAGGKYPDLKNNVFPSEINLLILRLDRKSKCLAKPSKMKVYEYVASSLRCKTEHLIHQAKKLVLEDERKRLKELLLNLKIEIGKVMPTLLESHEKESKFILEKRSAQENAADNEDVKLPRMPKRRFIWNDTTKKLLKDILMLKKRCLLLEGKNREALDLKMLEFLKSDIQILWPEGWMSMNALNKIYTTYADPKRLVHSNNPTAANATSSAAVPSVSAAPTTSSSTVSQNKPSTTPGSDILKNLPQSFNSSSLSIIPIVPAVSTSASIGGGSSSKVNPSSVSVNNKVASNSNELTVNLSTKPSLPEQKPLPPAVGISSVAVACDVVEATPPPPPRKNSDGKNRPIAQASDLFGGRTSASGDGGSNHNQLKTLTESMTTMLDVGSPVVLNSVLPPPPPPPPLPSVVSATSKDTTKHQYAPAQSDRFSPQHHVAAASSVSASSSSSAATSSRPLLQQPPQQQDRFTPPRLPQHHMQHAETKSHQQEDASYQAIDLSDKNESTKAKSQLPVVAAPPPPPPSARREFLPEINTREATITPINPLLSHPPATVVSNSGISGSSSSNKHHELSITPAYPKIPQQQQQHHQQKVDHSDDIQKVIDDLKVLEKMSSPKKSVAEASGSSAAAAAVSVIAVNKSFAPKTTASSSSSTHHASNSIQSSSHHHHQQHHHSQNNNNNNHHHHSGSTSSGHSNKSHHHHSHHHNHHHNSREHSKNNKDMSSSSSNNSEYTSKFQEEFQKQLLGAASTSSSSTTTAGSGSSKAASNPNSTIDRYPPHIPGSGEPSLTSSDKYFQNSNNNYSRSSNGHKSTTSAPQSGNDVAKVPLLDHD